MKASWMERDGAKVVRLPVHWYPDATHAPYTHEMGISILVQSDDFPDDTMMLHDWVKLCKEQLRAELNKLIDTL